MNKEKIIEKIKKMLSLAGNNSSQEEAQTAMLKAQEMLAKYKLEMKDIEINDEEKAIDKQATEFSGRTAWWYKSLAKIIGDNFRCYTYINKRYNQSAIHYIGTLGDIDICISVFSYALKIIDNSMKNYIKQLRKNGCKTDGIKNDYISGFLKGLKDKFKEQIMQNEQYALMLVTPKIVSEEVNKRKFRHVKSQAKIQMANNIRARTEGYKQGQSFGDIQKRKYITV